jgi:hypothetical protein
MIWLTWRQHRAQAAVGAVILAVAVVGLAVLGNVARERARTLGLPDCLDTEGDCAKALEAMAGHFHSIPPVTGTLIVLPVLAGLFIGAPLVSREYEAGTHRLVWTQSVSPLRWISSKIALIFGALALGALAIGLLTTWTLDPLTAAFGGRFNSTWYDISGIVPVACMLFALSLGVASSALIRRTIPAMAVTLTVYVVVRIPMHWIRVHFAPVHTTTVDVPLTTLLQNPGGAPVTDFPTHVGADDLLLSGSVTDSAGHLLPNNMANDAILRQYCPELSVDKTSGGLRVAADKCGTAIEGLNLHYQIRSQPASHFWAIQTVETTIFLTLTAALIVVATLAVTRRRPT